MQRNCCRDNDKRATGIIFHVNNPSTFCLLCIFLPCLLAFLSTQRAVSVRVCFRVRVSSVHVHIYIRIYIHTLLASDLSFSLSRTYTHIHVLSLSLSLAFSLTVICSFRHSTPKKHALPSKKKCSCPPSLSQPPFCADQVRKHAG